MNIILTIMTAVLLAIPFQTTSFAMTRATSETVAKPDYEMATGFYGGIRKGKLKLILSEQGGVRYYGLPAGQMVLSGGKELLKLPFNTPIQVKSRNGNAFDISVLEARP